MTLFSLSPFLNTTDNSVLISKMQQEKGSQALRYSKRVIVSLWYCVGEGY